MVDGNEMIVDDKIFVAVGKDVKESKSTLIWALHNSKGMELCIIYVHVPAKMIPMLMGGKFPASKVGAKELKAFRDKEQKEMRDILDSYLEIIAKAGVRAEKIHIETDSTIEEEIVELISQHRIEKLVMGAASDRAYSRKMIEPKSKKAVYVRQHASDYCHIWFVCKGCLISKKAALKHPDIHIKEKPSNASTSYQLGGQSLSQDTVSRYEGSSGDFCQSSRTSFSQSSVEAESFFSDTKEPSLKLVALPQSKDKRLGSSPPSVLESRGDDDHYDQLMNAMMEAEKSRRGVFSESMRRRKAEKEALDSIRKAETTESLYYEELRLRKAREEELAKTKEELEHTKLSLETQINKSNLAMKELEEKLFSAVESLEKYQNENDELKMERNNAPMFSLFSFSDLEKATNHFDPNLKIGEGGYGTIYKGFLRHTKVAIKILNPNSMQGPQEFNQEVDVLSKLRHPNVVTLIGTCPESWALVYEYLPGGNLEDRLNCKNNLPPLPWQTRIKIATELCSVLIFLHSSRPNCIIHGDLKSSNLLLDENHVCKLSDFGFSVSETNTSTFFVSTEPKGTFSYMDPEFLLTGELTPQSDVYSFGIILLRLLTGKPALGLAKVVMSALEKGDVGSILDVSAGEWPFVQAEQVASVALRCCDVDRLNRPELESDVWRVLEPMKASCQSLSMVQLASDEQVPIFFICPIFQEIMEDPQIAANGFTYEGEAIRGWIDGVHNTSPMTNVTLSNHNLTPNRALRSAIQEWLQHKPQVNM